MGTLAAVFTTDWIIGLIITILIVAGLIVLCVLIGRKKKNDKTLVSLEPVEQETKVEQQPVEPDEEEVIGNLVTLLVRRTYTVGRYNKVKPGSYHVTASSDDDNKLMIRLNDFVKEYENEFDLVLSEGETICPVSKSIVLKEVEEQENKTEENV